MRKYLFQLIALLVFLSVCYGLGRLYFQLTGGFTLSNISSNFAYQPDWEVRPLSEQENKQLDKALSQSYSYLGKGCQSYVFESQDGKYVIKFFKYQRFRIQPWITYFPPLPAMVQYRKEKEQKKWIKLDGFVKSWKLAFEHLKPETGLVYVHLNKTSHLNKNLIIYDKMGWKHELDLDHMEFCIQFKADMLCNRLKALKRENDLNGSKQLIDNLLALILSEYARGLADNDHALMQNTGVFDGKPIHIDVGQFVMTDLIKDPAYLNVELYTKFYKFHLWLKENDPVLANYLDGRLAEIIGSDYATMKPQWRNK